MTTEKKPTKAQLAAEKKAAAFLKSVLAALGKKPTTMREIAAKLKLANEDGSVKPSVANKIRGAIDVLAAEGKAVADGTRSGRTYRKA